MYQAATGMRASLDRQSVIAANLARQSIPGARQSIPAFEVKDDTKTLGRSSGDLNSHVVSKHLQIRTDMLTDYRPGPIVQTGDSLHFAIQGNKSFFRIKDRATSEELVTRNGSFYRATDGRILTTDGDEVLTDGGNPLTLQSASGIEADSTGRIKLNEAEVGKLGFVSFDDPARQLADAGNGRYVPMNEEDKRSGMASTDQVIQRSLEYSNTDVVGSAITMMQTLRLFEANQKAFAAQDEVTGRLIRMAGEKS